MDSTAGSESRAAPKPKARKACEIQTCTIRNPPFSYAQLELLSGPGAGEKPCLDEITVRSYCSAALTRFLGATGAAISLDILKVHENQCWVRVPREDLAAFAAAITAWRGASEGSVDCAFRLLQCSDWLGSMVGRAGQEELWHS
jgi:ribonuclease P/MRP protein subunit POP8